MAGSEYKRAVLYPIFSRDVGVFILFALLIFIAGASISLPAQGGGFLGALYDFFVNNINIGYLAERTDFPLAFALSYGLSIFIGLVAGFVLCCIVGDYRYLDERIDGVGVIRSVVYLFFVVTVLSWPLWGGTGDSQGNESYWRARALLGVISSGRVALMIFSAGLYLLYAVLTFWVIATISSLRKRIL